MVFEKFPPTEIAMKMAVSTSVGMLVGFEREWSHKDAGVRTFAITCLLGMLCGLLGQPYALVSLGGVIALTLLVSTRNTTAGRQLETTTAVVLITTVVLGIFIGQGHVFTPVAGAIIVTMLLSMKEQFRRMTGGIQPKEIRSAVLLGLLGFVIYPALPNHYIDRWNLLNPREAWVTVIVVAAIGFMNYVLLRIYSRRGLYYAAILGGLVNSTATVAELASWITLPGVDPIRAGVTISMLTTVAMFVRNLVIMAIFSLHSALRASAPLVVMMGLSAAISWLYRRKKGEEQDEAELDLDSPVSLGKVLKFGAIFVVIEIAGTLAQRSLGEVGFLLVSVVGGLASSASTTAAAAHLAARGQLTPEIAGMGAVLTSITSALVNLPVVQRQTRRKDLSIRLAWLSGLVALAGIMALWVEHWLVA